MRRARSFVIECCAATRLNDDLAYTVALLVSELVTNAVTHGASAATIEVACTAVSVRVTVRDDNLVSPAVRAADLDAEGGRGLLILASLATSWGIEPTATGKSVWFEVQIGTSKSEDPDSSAQ